MPGVDPMEAARIIAGELPDFPHLAELPGRGPGADLTGRAAALLVDIPAEVTPRGWRIAERPGRDLRRASEGIRCPLRQGLAAPSRPAASDMRIVAVMNFYTESCPESTRPRELNKHLYGDE